MRWLRISLFTLAGLAAILFTLITVLFTLDFGRFKDRIESEVTDLLGREFRIDGVLHANVGASIEVYAEDAFLANPDWAHDDAFVAVHKIDIAVDLWSLIDGPIIVERAEIDGIRVNIEKNDEAASWQFEALQSDDDADEQQEVQEPRARLAILPQYIAITDTRVSFNTPSREEPLIFSAQTLSASLADDFVQIHLVGTLNETDVEVTKIVGPIGDMIDYRNVSVDLTGQVGEIAILGKAIVDDMLAPKRPTLDINISGPNARYLSDVLGVAPVTSGPMQFSASLREVGDGLDASINGTYGEFALDIDGKLESLQELDEIELQVSAGGPDIGTILRLAGRQYSEVDPFALEGRIRRRGEVLQIDDVKAHIGASRFEAAGTIPNFPMAKDASLNATALGPDFGRFLRLFGMPGTKGGEFTSSLSLASSGNGRTRLSLAANAPFISLNVQSELTDADQFVDSTLELSLAGPNIGVIANALGFPGLPDEEWQVVGNVRKDGPGYRLSQTSITAGDDIFKIDGHIGNKPLGSSTDLTIDFSGTDLGASVVALGGNARRLPKGGYRLTGHVLADNNRLTLRDLKASIGDDSEYQFNVSGFIEDKESFEGSEIELQARGASLSALTELAGLDDIPDSPFDIAANLRRGVAQTMISKGSLNIGDIHAEFSGRVGDRPMRQDMSLNLDATVPDLRGMLEEFGVSPDSIPAGDLEFSVVLSGIAGSLDLKKFDAALAGNDITVSGDLGPLPKFEGTRLDIAIKGSQLSSLLPESDWQQTMRRPYSASTKVLLNNKELKIESLQLRLDDSSLAGTATVQLEPMLGRGKFSMKSDSPNLYELFPISVHADQTLTAPMKMQASGSWLENVWTIDEFEFGLGKGRLRIEGTVNGPPNFDNTDLHVEALVASVSNLGPLVGRELPDQSLQFTAHFVGDANAMTTDELDLTLGPSDLTGNFHLSGGDRLKMDLDISSKLLDLSQFMPEPEVEAEQPEAPPRDSLIPDTPLALKPLHMLDATVSVNIGELILRTIDARDFSVVATLLDGTFELEKLALTGQRGGHLQSTGKLVSNGESADLQFSVHGQNLILGLDPETEEDLKQLPVFDLQLAGKARGSSPREVASSLDGYLRVVGGSGKVKAGSFTFLTQDFVSEVFNTINPFAKTDPYTEVDCSAILLIFDDGKVTGDPAFVQQTEKLRIFGSANIDLETEKLDASFRTVPRKGLGLSVTNLVNPYIKVAGTLADPSLTIDPEGVLIEGGAAIATAGISILAKSFKDRFLSTNDPCGKAIADAEEEFARKRSSRE